MNRQMLQASVRVSEIQSSLLTPRQLYREHQLERKSNPSLSLPLRGAQLLPVHWCVRPAESSKRSRVSRHHFGHRLARYQIKTMLLEGVLGSGKMRLNQRSNVSDPPQCPNLRSLYYQLNVKHQSGSAVSVSHGSLLYGCNNPFSNLVPQVARTPGCFLA
jgi:hypothetical protein